MNGISRGFQLRVLIICTMASTVLGAPGLASAGSLGKDGKLITSFRFSLHDCG